MPLWNQQTVHERLATLPGPAPARAARRRQPVHTVYGGAHRFSAGTLRKLGQIAWNCFREYAPHSDDLRRFGAGRSLDDAAMVRLYDMIAHKLQHGPVEDYRIDFEDGFGPRGRDEERHEAVRSATEAAQLHKQGQLPQRFGIRVRALNQATGLQAIDTLNVFLDTFFDAGTRSFPPDFVITLPKVCDWQQVAVLRDWLSDWEHARSLPQGLLGIELMLETPAAFVSRAGMVSLPAWFEAGCGRVRSVHLGAYDLTASLGIVAHQQRLDHPACAFARHLGQLSCAEYGIPLVDGATTELPLATHRGNALTEAQTRENSAAIYLGWAAHFKNVTEALQAGIYQGWDLHPHQFIPRYAAVYGFFHEALPAVLPRLVRFLEQAAQAQACGGTFDDAATAEGLINLCLFAVDCGAIAPGDLGDRLPAIERLRHEPFASLLQP